MARLARLVIPGLPHHVTQRGNGRARTFFGDDDYALYRDLLVGVTVTVHLIDIAVRWIYYRVVWPASPVSLSPASHTMSPSAAMAARAPSSVTMIMRSTAI